jgi:hypothetical protein
VEQIAQLKQSLILSLSKEEGRSGGSTFATVMENSRNSARARPFC